MIGCFWIRFCLYLREKQIVALLKELMITRSSSEIKNKMYGREDGYGKPDPCLIYHSNFGDDFPYGRSPQNHYEEGKHPAAEFHFPPTVRMIDCTPENIKLRRREENRFFWITCFTFNVGHAFWYFHLKKSSL